MLYNDKAYLCFYILLLNSIEKTMQMEQICKKTTT